MRDTRALLVALLCSSSQTARAETVVASDQRSNELCRVVEAELVLIGIELSRRPSDESIRRARRRSFSKSSVDALVVCRSRPDRIEVYYPDGSRLGKSAFTVVAEGDRENAAVDVSERVRSERFVADVPVPVPYSPPVWWLGIGGDVLFSPGGIAPLAFITIDAGYRFHRHWSAQVIASIQPYTRRLRADSLETRLRLDQFGGALSYHPLVLPRVDLALGVRATAVRIGVRGTTDAQDGTLVGQSDTAWVAFPAARLTLRVGLAGVLWLRMQGEIGAIVPKAVVSAGPEIIGSLGEFAAQTGLALEVQFR